MARGASDLVVVAMFVFLLGIHGATAVDFTFRNNCPETVWPAAVTGGGPAFPTTGFELKPGASLSVTGVLAKWSGRLWGRNRCSASGGRFSCELGDCGTGQVECNGAGGAPPTTLAEFTLGDGSLKDFYDVSNVDGFNLPLEIKPVGDCPTTSCPANINRVCPNELAVNGTGGGAGAGAVVACKSACLALDKDEYCCRGQFASPATCKPSSYSMLFKAQCPQAYSYAFDDRSSTFTCGNATAYQVTFCPVTSL